MVKRLSEHVTLKEARLYDSLRDLLGAAEQLDAYATSRGHGRCNGIYAGNVATEGCPLCDARRLLNTIDTQ